jgi:2-oxoglutarate dehydrogenase E1 component
MRAAQLVYAYQTKGHNVANLDPLGIGDADLDASFPVELDFRSYDFTEADLQSKIHLGSNMLTGFMGQGQEEKTLQEILDRLNETYCQNLGIEYMHINSSEEQNW